MNEFKAFDASTVELKDANIIEASAGTGKTYSIAILAVRLVVEKGLSINEILMVTFTKAAVAELQERVWLFMRYAYDVSQGGRIPDFTIASIVERAQILEGNETVANRLDMAIRDLDEICVLTIHGFSQKTLTELAFETEQMFGAEVLQDINELLEDCINMFWRKYITTLPAALLKELVAFGFNKSGISKIVSNHLSGKKLLGYDPRKNYDLASDEIADIIALINLSKSKHSEALSLIANKVEENAHELYEIASSNRYAAKSFAPHLKEPEAFVLQLIAFSDKAYVSKLFPEYLDMALEVKGLKEKFEELVLKAIVRIQMQAIGVVVNAILSEKAKSNLLTFDDLIEKLHRAIMGSNQKRLSAILQRKYKAVFIDEFQDTDRQQYEIFNTAFQGNSILFYIGDPKQSIYAWRKADIFTYFKASNDVDHRYGMNTNYRSSVEMIDAMNVFFKPVENFDTFYFNQGQAVSNTEIKEIQYVCVDSPSPNTKGHFMEGDLPAKGISVSEHSKKDSVIASVASSIMSLLSDAKYKIEKSGHSRSLRPSDIGILVRSHKEAVAVKESLARYNIPAVHVNDSLILKSEESDFIYFAMVAILDNSRGHINRALLSGLTGITRQDLLMLDETKVLNAFMRFREKWEKQGVYAALIHFIETYGILDRYRNGAEGVSEKSITNLFQIIELLHKTQSHREYTPAELIEWMKRAMEGDKRQGDEFVQRIESDNEAVNIITIHQSKGLEFNIVMAPFLDFNLKIDDWVSFRDPLTGEYMAGIGKDLSPEHREIVAQQLEQENRRLLYVAITRAVYKCYIFRNSFYKNSTLLQFVNLLPEGAHPQIEYIQVPEEQEGLRYYVDKHNEHTFSQREVSFYLTLQNWRQVSYSRLAAEHEQQFRPAALIQEDPYDQFIFKDLLRGAQTGNLLHYLFENIQFDRLNSQERIINQAINRFMPRQQEAYQEGLKTMLYHVLEQDIHIGDTRFQLKDISTDRQLHEFEFDFSFPVFDVAQLAELSDEHIAIHVRDEGEILGVMNGKMDLFFQHEGRFYILDWKSNYLGDTLDAYSQEELAKAMNDNNYHLQYLIYTFAAIKYLRSRMPDFDYDRHFGGVIYLFVRGVRHDSNYGIFTAKPSVDKVIQLTEILYGSLDVTI